MASRERQTGSRGVREGHRSHPRALPADPPGTRGLATWPSTLVLDRAPHRRPRKTRTAEEGGAHRGAVLAAVPPAPVRRLAGGSRAPVRAVPPVLGEVHPDQRATSEGSRADRL